ncbi:MAG: hypothetical protein BroJett014_11450 [Planctomycetota bacterium]|nr:hypothetical protein [Planctomycetota bacterium]GIK52172.1 MAG: hypothetical protein BroJett014_11450 [Planctomycetota bacterium]
MLLALQQLKCNAAASERGRYALNAVALTDKGALSSDGRILLFIPYPDAAPDVAPVIDGVNALSPKPDGTPFIIDAKEAAQAIAALISKGKAHDYGFDWTKVVQAEIVGDVIVLATTDLTNSRLLTLNRAEGEFPEVGGVIPDYREAHTITFSLDYLLQVAKTLRAASKSQTVTLRFIDDETAVGLSCDDGVAMLLMPFEPPHNADALAVLRDPEVAARRALEQSPPGLFLAPPQPESEMLPAKVFSDND